MPHVWDELPLVTGVGSLPETDAELAIDFVATMCPELPFWPQLPQRAPTEGLLRQFLGQSAKHLEARRDGAGYRLKPGTASIFREELSNTRQIPNAEHAAGLHAFLEGATKGRFRAARAVKGQITGPVTFASLLADEEGSTTSKGAWFKLLADFVADQAVAQVRALRSLDRPVLLVIDEPGFHVLGPAPESSVFRACEEALGRVVAAARTAGAWVGIHCCSRPPFGVLRRTELDLISFDAYHGLESFFSDGDARAMASGDGLVAYGLVPTGMHSAEATTEALTRRFQNAASSAGDLSKLIRHALITASCGHALDSPTTARTAFELARDIARSLRNSI